MKTPALKIKIGRLCLNNPVMVASGTFGYGREFKDFFSLKKLGAVVTKTITLNPRQGNLGPRTCETPAGMLNAIGLENPGLEVFLKDKLPELAKIGVPVIVSIASEEDPEEFASMAGKLDKIKSVTALELNISCPNIRRVQGSGVRVQGSGLIAQDPKATYEAVKKVRKVTSKTIITKLSPNVTDITVIARAAEDAGSDALALVNTLTGLCIDIAKRRPCLGFTTGGLSGPAIRPVALRMVWEAYRKVKIPIIGMGGIVDTASALEFFIAGASAVSVGTGNFINPLASVEIVAGLKKYLAGHKISSIQTLTGSLKV